MRTGASLLPPERMIRVRYVGLHPDFAGQQAYAKFNKVGDMFIQVDGKLNNKTRGPECYIGGKNYAIGWHKARKSDWLLA